MISEELTLLLEEFAKTVIKEKPTKLLHFAANYFKTLAEENELLQTESRQEDDYIHRYEDEYDFGQNSEKHDSIKSGVLTTLGNRLQYMNTRRKSVASESFNPASESHIQPIIYPKSAEQKLRLNAVIKSIFIFRSLDEEQLAKVIDAMRETPVTNGQIIIHQGEDGDFFYVIESGLYDVFVNDLNVRSYNGSGSFGELALMYNTTRAATITARSDGILWALDRLTFRQIVLRNAFLKRQLYENWFNSVPLLNSLNSYERSNLADALISRTYEDGDWIIKEGDLGTEMYFIEEGCVQISAKSSNGEQKVIKNLQKNEYFGELALILHEPRKASAAAIGTTKLAVLDVSSFERLMGPCVEIMQREVGRYRAQLIELLGPEGVRNFPTLANFIESEISYHSPSDSNEQ